MLQTCTNLSFYILIATSNEKHEKIYKIFLINLYIAAFFWAIIDVLRHILYCKYSDKLMLSS